MPAARLVSVCLCGLAVVAGIGLAVRTARQFEPGAEAQASPVRVAVEGGPSWRETVVASRPEGSGQEGFAVPGTLDQVVELGIVRVEPGAAPTSDIAIATDGWLGARRIASVAGPTSVNEVVRRRFDRSRLGATVAYRPVVGSSDGLAFLAPVAFDRADDDRFNVVLVSFDTLRADHLGFSDYQRAHTPNLDRFAADSVVFTKAISPAPWTTPAHFSLFTGVYPSVHRNRREPAESLRTHETLAEVLRRAGYYTVAFTGGASVSSKFGFANGFNRYREYPMAALGLEQDGPGVDVSERLFSDAQRWLETNHDLRFFLFLHTFECHDPYEDERFLTGSDVGIVAQRRARYDGDIARADELLGGLLDTLRSLGLMSSTIVVFLSDHGEEFDDHYRWEDVIGRRSAGRERSVRISDLDHGHSLYEEIVNVPLVIHVPGLQAPSPRLHNTVSLVDVMPTVIDLLDLEQVADGQGVSLVDLMTTGARDTDPPVFSEFTSFGPERKSVHADGYKYIWIEDLDEIQGGWTLSGLRPVELFHLASDPDELRDLSAAEEDRVAEMHQNLIAHLRESQRIGDSRRGGVAVSDSATIDADVAEDLRALGYLE